MNLRDIVKISPLSLAVGLQRAVLRALDASDYDTVRRLRPLVDVAERRLTGPERVIYWSWLSSTLGGAQLVAGVA